MEKYLPKNSCCNTGVIHDIDLVVENTEQELVSVIPQYKVHLDIRDENKYPEYR
jgi:hypothetical protein